MAYSALMVGICKYPGLSPEEGWILQQIASWYRPEKLEMYRHPTKLTEDCKMSKASFYRHIKKLVNKDLLTKRYEHGKHYWDINYEIILSQYETNNSQYETGKSQDEKILSQYETLEGKQ